MSPSLNSMQAGSGPGPGGVFAVGSDPLSAFGLLHAVDGVNRWPDPERLAEAALRQNTGSKRWAGWKGAQLEDVLGLAQSSARVQLLDVNLQGDFNAIVRISTPAPCWPREGRLRIADHAVVHLNYQQDWLMQPPPPWMPVGLLYPSDIYLPNARPGPRGDICLGAISPGVPVVELAWLSYFATSAQTLTLDETEGVLNPDASEFYRQHPEFLPLTRTGLLEPWSLDELRETGAIFLSDGEGGQP